MVNDYTGKLKDPRWQKKRLEIFKRDDWTCQFCGDKTNTLTVHHKDYLPNTAPWDYPNNLLITLCAGCHEGEGNNAEIVNSIIHNLKHSFNGGDLLIIDDGLSILNKAIINHTDSYMLAEILRWIFSDPTLRKELDERCWAMMTGKLECQRVTD